MLVQLHVTHGLSTALELPLEFWVRSSLPDRSCDVCTSSHRFEGARRLNFVEVLNLSEMLDKAGVDFEWRNFEETYDQLYKDEKYSGIRQDLEEAVYDFFNSLKLPDHPTIYDHLVLSLRDKDVIATFNWDPFLTQAYRRNVRGFKLPRLQFLHGNVTIGYCGKDKVMGVNGNACSRCGERLSPSIM